MAPEPKSDETKSAAEMFEEAAAAINAQKAALLARVSALETAVAELRKWAGLDDDQNGGN